MRKVRFIEMRDMDPYEAYSIRESLISLIGSGRSPSTLTFTQFSRSFASLGARANIKEKIRSDYCRENGIPIVRSIYPHVSSGFHDTNALRMGLFISKDSPIISELGIESIRRAIIKTLEILGIHVSIPIDSNNILVEKKKIGACLITLINNVVASPFVLLRDFNYEEAEKAIVSEKDMRQHLTTLGKNVSVNEIKNAVKQAYEETLGVVFENDDLTVEERSKAEEFLLKYRSDSWLKLGQWSPVKDYRGV